MFVVGLLEAGALLGKNGAIYTENKKLFDIAVEKYQKTTNKGYWEKQSDWSVDKVFIERYKKQKDMLEKYFIPHIKNDQIIGDLACANGDWIFLIANYAGRVDGFEYAAKMVEVANERADKQGIENVTFQQTDACSVKFENEYDNFMMMGLLTCILNPNDAMQIVNNVFGAIKRGGDDL